MSWKPEVSVYEDGEHKFYQNSLVFATKEEAEASAKDTFNRWMLATGHRAVESDLEPNYKWVESVGSVRLGEDD